MWNLLKGMDFLTLVDLFTGHLLIAYCYMLTTVLGLAVRGTGEPWEGCEHGRSGISSGCRKTPLGLCEMNGRA